MIAVAVALLRSFARDRGALSLAFIAPLVFFGALAIFYRHLDSPEGVHFRIAVVAPKSEVIGAFADALLARQGGRIAMVRFERPPTAEDLASLDGVISIAKDFSPDMPHVTVESRSPLPGVAEVMGYLVAASFADAYGVDRRRVTIDGRSSEGRLLRENVSAIPVMFILFATSSLAGRGLGDDEAGFAERLQSLGLSRRRRVLARWLALSAIAAAQMAVTLGFAAAFFGIVPVMPLGLGVAAIAASAACAAFVVALAEGCGSRARFAAISPVATLVLAGLGGSMVPAQLLPPALAWPSRWLFTGWSIEACAAAVDGAGFLKPTVLLVSFTIVMLVVATTIGARRVLR